MGLALHMHQEVAFCEGIGGTIALARIQGRPTSGIHDKRVLLVDLHFTLYIRDIPLTSVTIA